MRLPTLRGLRMFALLLSSSAASRAAMRAHSLRASLRSAAPLCTAAKPARAGTVTEDGQIILEGGHVLGLSPSSVSTFEQCPLLFRRRHVERLREPVNPELAAGIVAHKALAAKEHHA